MTITVLGLDFKTAGVELREQVALSGDQTLRLLDTIAAEKMFSEALVLSTCNRTEFYVCGGGEAQKSLGRLLGHVARIKGADPVTQLSAFWRRDGLQAVSHLFGVAAGLESQVVGEHEIMGQVKEAYRIACEARTAKFILHKLLHWTFRAGKRVMTETTLGQGTASVAQAAVDLAAQVFSHLADRTVLLIGAGQTAESAAQALLREGVRRLIVANRTLYKAQQLAGDFVQYVAQQRQRGPAEAQEFACPALRQLQAQGAGPQAAVQPSADLDARAIGLEELPGVLHEADLVISSTASQDPVLTYDRVQSVLSRRRRPLLMIDIAVPRDIDPRLAELPNVLLYNIDALEGLVSRNVHRRQAEVPKAQAIIDDEVRQFEQWLATLDVVPTIQLLQQRIRSLGQAEMERYLRKLPPEAQRQMEEFARTLCNKIMHDPIMFLKRLDSPDGKSDPAAIQTLRQIFGLDSTEQPQ
jgi:glutamyl-tRNA reductase